MGNYCCADKEEINPLSKKIIKATSIKLSKNNILHKGKGHKNLIQIYDIEQNESKSFEINFFIINNLESFTQLSAGNWLYLCGEYGIEDNGSVFLKFDLLSPLKNINMLVNSVFPHYRPSMCFFKKDHIIVVGGRNSIKCEIFHKNSNKWRLLPDLPEERFGATVINDDKSDSIYLFGGYCHKVKSFCCSLLRMNLKTNVQWDTIIVKNPEYLARSFQSSTKSKKNSIIILGGQTQYLDYTDDIVEFDLTTKCASLLSVKLYKPCKFELNCIAENSGLLYFCDEDDLIQRLSIRENNSAIVCDLKEELPIEFSSKDSFGI